MEVSPSGKTELGKTKIQQRNKKRNQIETKEYKENKKKKEKKEKKKNKETIKNIRKEETKIKRIDGRKL